jgi:hypothetical protein
LNENYIGEWKSGMENLINGSSGPYTAYSSENDPPTSGWILASDETAASITVELAKWDERFILVGDRVKITYTSSSVLGFIGEVASISADDSQGRPYMVKFPEGEPGHYKREWLELTKDEAQPFMEAY